MPLEVDVAHRDVCWTCHRPKSVCWCGDLRPVESRTHVVFIQHPRETRVPVSTCRMAHRSLPNSELHIALKAQGNARLEAVCAEGDVAVLFPSEGATDVSELANPPKTLIVVDGTWSNAKKVVEKCPLLSKLPRLSFTPERPGNYRIRKEPAEHCLSTIEAVTYVLERLESAPGRFVPLLNVFDAMVDRQLEYIRSRGPANSRHAFTRRRNSVPLDHTHALRDAFERLVVVFGEANSWPVDHPQRPTDDTAELVQLVAERLSTGERFSALLRPHRPLGPTVAFHLDVAERSILEAPTRDAVIADWRAFTRPDDVMVGWGVFCFDLLEREAVTPREFINLRSIVAQQLKEKPGSVEARAMALGVELPVGAGRAARRLAALAAVTRSLIGRAGVAGEN